MVTNSIPLSRTRRDAAARSAMLSVAPLLAQGDSIDPRRWIDQHVICLGIETCRDLRAGALEGAGPGMR